MFAPRRLGSGPRRSERAAAGGGGYVETDPTGRYGRFNEVLGKGAMKTVFRAFDELHGVEVAWNQAKLCDVLRSHDALQRMYSEVHLLSTLRHDSIIRFHASWVDVGSRTFNFITEMFTSGTLREYRLKYPRVNIRAVKNWARQILQGLVYLHSHDPPVIHRDLKCDNIFVNGHLGQVKIGDLGLAAVLRGSQSAHSVIGTPEFMAPELYEEDYNELVDIYSFGMCILEMLTAEYPYSECSNPAQIYKKVTSGKLPAAYHRIEDPEAHRFIGRCLVAASSRPSAQELLLDPFLSLDDHTMSASCVEMTDPMSRILDRTESDNRVPLLAVEEPEPVPRTDMTITGKLNPEDDTIFLKVQIADETGPVRNIYFPFDIVSDTPIDVANEMVKELEITDREPSEIAEMIEQEIATLAPGWTNEAGPQEHQEYTYADGDDPPFYYLSSSPASSQDSLCGVGPSQGFSSPRGRPCQDQGWFQDYSFTDDDDMSSMHSGKHSSARYFSGSEAQTEPSNSKREAQPNPNMGPRSTHSLAMHVRTQCHVGTDPRGGRARHRLADDPRRMMRNRSLVDVRSQLLHRTLVEELNKRLFNTVAAVENIGFRVPCYDSSRRAPSTLHGDRRKTKSKYKV